MTPEVEFNWDDLRTFLACADASSFRQAAERLGVRSSTVVRRVDRLETALGLVLFSRQANGVRLTNEGRRLAANARRFQESERNLLRDLSAMDTSRRGTVRVATTEGIGSYWLTPHLVQFQRAHPLLIVELLCANHAADVRNFEADIAVQLEPPTTPDILCRKLGRMHLAMFASKKYLSVYGRPRSREEMLEHRIVDQFGEQVDSAWARYLGIDNLEGVIGIRTNSSIATYIAVESGSGIGALPNYSKLLGADIEHVDIGLRRHFDVFMTFRNEANKIPRVRTVADWLVSCFDSKTYPFFGDAYLDPDELLDSGRRVKRILQPNPTVFEP